MFWIGFEDGLAGGVCRDYGLDPKSAFAYRKGFAAGVKAAGG